MIRVEISNVQILHLVMEDAGLSEHRFGSAVRRMIAERIAPFVFEPKRHEDLMTAMLIRSCQFDSERQVYVYLID